MRMRKKKNLVPRMDVCRNCWVTDPFAQRGHWHELMPQAKEIRVELGCGKGRFTVDTAKSEPDILLIAVEKVPDAMVMAMERAKEAGLSNVFFVDGDAALLSDMFAPGEVDRLYLNFCDPWPKSNQKKRRLTHGNFLKVYRKVLKTGGQIHFKTDNDKLFEWSIEEIPQFGFALSEVTRDLHADGPVGVMTDYEARFYAEGKSINRCVATKVDWAEPAPTARETRLIACCGLNCETCDARIATITNDEALRVKTAELWSRLNGVEITPEMIRCTGCRVAGPKSPYCDGLCPIRKCAAEKGCATCADCPQQDACEKLSAITANNESAKENLRHM